MSPNDQAFVKAFSRRNQHSRPNVAQPASPSAAQPTTAMPPIKPPGDRTPPRPWPAFQPEGENDPGVNRLMRVDVRDAESVPAPHTAPPTRQPSPQPLATLPVESKIASLEHLPPSTAPVQPTPTKATHDSQSAAAGTWQHSFSTLTSVGEIPDLASLYSKPEPLHAPESAADTTATIPGDPPTNSETTTYRPAGKTTFEPPGIESEIVHQRIDPAVTYPTNPIDHAASELTSEPTSEPTSELTSERTGESPPITSPFAEPVNRQAGHDVDPPAELSILRAAWEVDVFDVPTAVADLFFDGLLFQQVAQQILQAVQTGLTSIMITSVRRGEGRSTVAIGMAMAAAATGLRVALVDADTHEPTLADDLRLELEYGWVETVRGGLATGEIAVHAIEDGVTLIPLLPPPSGAAVTQDEVQHLLQSLRGKFDLIVVDTPSHESATSQAAAAVTDTALIVRDATRTSNEEVNHLSYRLRENGIQGVGVVNNFT